jgi:hypothetical protein
MPLRKDIWRVGIVPAPLTKVLEAGSVDGFPTVWLPELPPLTFMADPFGLWRDERLNLFVETYDYRERLGRIEVLILDRSFNVLTRRVALEEPWHLSYPFLIESEGAVYMLPEAHRSGRLTLYRAEDLPFEWKPVHTIGLDHVPIDATPAFYDGLWWLFYTPARSRAEKFGALHVAFAPTLMGPWRAHPLNPVRFDMSSARPGGTPIISSDGIILPVQDCSRTYGGAMRALHITRLTPDKFEATAAAAIRAPASAWPYTAGFHTLSAAGAVTLVDAKRFSISPRSLASDVSHAVGKLLRRGQS